MFAIFLVLLGLKNEKVGENRGFLVLFPAFPGFYAFFGLHFRAKISQIIQSTNTFGKHNLLYVLFGSSCGCRMISQLTLVRGNVVRGPRHNDRRMPQY